MEYTIPKQLLERMEVVEEEIKEIRAQAESVRLREQHLQKRYARLQSRYTYLATRLDALEKQLQKQLHSGTQSEQLQMEFADAVSNPALMIAPVKKKEAQKIDKKNDDKNLDNVHLLSIKEAADMMDVSTRTVMLYLKEGKLEGTKIKGRWRLRPEDVRDCLDTHHIRRRAKKEEDAE